MWNLCQTIVFTMVIAHTASAFWHHFHAWITKNMDLEIVSHFGTPNHRQIRKRCPKWLPRDSQNNPKITKTAYLDLQVPVGWPLESPDHSNDHSRHPKWSLKVSKMSVFGTKSDTFQHHFSNQPVSNCLLTRGRRQGAKPLNIDVRVIYIYIYIYTYIYI